ncbi:DDE_3 domain-containing protein [Trichonephila clavipes]|nr:DDE_3 domain-containing protein [Trichonephila clavipes]
MIMPDRIELVWWRTCLKLKQYSVWNGQCALPDLNPIEHVWDILGRRIAARPRPPATVRDLEIALLEEWNSIPQSLIDNLIASMANRCAAVLTVRGDHTPY